MTESLVDVDNNYEILDEIGRGSYASVHKAINKLTGEICAIKKIRSNGHDLNNFTTLITEIGIQSNCKCENIVRFLACGMAIREVSIVMEYCCGSVKDVMKHLRRNMSIKQLTVITRDVLKGLDYLHAAKKIHRDVKAANILLNEEGIAKLGDFGVSESLNTRLDSDTSAKKATIIGTLLWIPPEVARADPNYSTAIDIWSLGITIIEMGDGHPPHSNISRDENAVLARIGNLDNPSPSFENPSNWPQELLDMLAMCLEKDASKRKTARELLDCEIMRNAPPNEVLKELVAEFTTTTVNQSESTLFKRYKTLLKENVSLCSIYDNRRMKVIRVDRMVDAHDGLETEFNRLSKRCQSKNIDIERAKKQVKDIEDDIQKLSHKKRELEVKLNDKRRRGIELKNSLSKIKEKLDDLNFKSTN